MTSALVLTGISLGIGQILCPYITKFDLVYEPEKATRRGVWLLIIFVLSPVALTLCWYATAWDRKMRYLDNLHLVFFSTSLIGSPYEEQESSARRRADELGIDLFAAYRESPDREARYSLAWMLITQESEAYYRLAKENVASVPWPEARIWRYRRGQESLSAAYREKLLDLLLASPTSEARLAAGEWYRKQGRARESEEAYHAAMTQGLFWDSLDAADELILHSQRYRADASRYLLSVLHTSDEFVTRAAGSLLYLYDVREELGPLAKRCDYEPRDGPNRRLLLEKLDRLAEQNADASQPNGDVP